jgi:hypothetical protein
MSNLNWRATGPDGFNSVGLQPFPRLFSTKLFSHPIVPVCLTRISKLAGKSPEPKRLNLLGEVSRPIRLRSSASAVNTSPAADAAVMREKTVCANAGQLSTFFAARCPPPQSNAIMVGKLSIYAPAAGVRH